MVASIRIDNIESNKDRLSTLFYLTIFCCDKDLQSVNRYPRMISRINLVVDAFYDLTSFSPTTSTNNTSIINDDLLDPSYDPCECDLYKGDCDINCCCDLDCTDDDKTTFQVECNQKVRRSFIPAVDDWFCRDVYNKPKLFELTWFPIICVHSKTTTLIGRFYSPNSLTADNTRTPSTVSSSSQKSISLSNRIKEKLSESYNINARYISKL
jgi:hypothetical protein